MLMIMRFRDREQKRWVTGEPSMDPEAQHAQDIRDNNRKRQKKAEEQKKKREAARQAYAEKRRETRKSGSRRRSLAF